jgi:hypothetical protein
LVPNPVNIDDDPLALGRAPHITEHTCAVLRGLILHDERLIDLDAAGAIT